MRWSLAVALVIAVTNFPAGRTPVESLAVAEGLQHECGLQTMRPQGFSVTATLSGYQFDEEGQFRTPMRITIGCSAIEPFLGSPADERWLRGAKVKYFTEELGSGSGGTEYLLTAVKQAPSGWIVMTQLVQIEFFWPDFSLGWAVLDRSHLVTS